MTPPGLHVCIIMANRQIKITFQTMIETSNHSRVRCEQHPNQQITNYCCNFNCLRPLCPECVEIHTKSNHSKQEIESWKNCLNKSFRNIRNTLASLRSIQNRMSAAGGGRPIQAIEQEAVRKLNSIKKQVLDIVNDVFNEHEKKIRNIIRTEFRVSPVDLSKLRLAIEELDKLTLKLTNPNTVLASLKKSILLDHDSLVSHFEEEFRHAPRSYKEQFIVNLNSDSLVKVGRELEQMLNYDSKTKHFKTTQEEFITRPGALSVRAPEYFKETGSKYLHFFVPFSKELKLLTVENANLNSTTWRTVKLNIKNDIPSFAKSIITPQGHIYITGGSDKGTKFNMIERYDEQRQTLQQVGKMIIPRSSHSICYMAGSIYLIGGFKTGNEACKDCQVYNITTGKSKTIGSLCFPAANSSATAFNDKYIFKFGGVQNKVQPSNHIQMYSLKENVWVEIDPQIQRVNENFWLLSFSACVQINSNEILVFGGYNDMEDQSSSHLSYTLYVEETAEDMDIMLRNIDAFPLPYAEGFWDNNPIVYSGKVFALQNVTDTDEVSSLVDQRRLLIFTGKKWLMPS